MTIEDKKKAFDEAVQPYVDTINIERAEAKYWYDSAMRSRKEFLDLLERYDQLKEEHRQIYMKLLGLNN